MITTAGGGPREFSLAGIDLDGTLLGPDLTISPENLAAIRKLHTRGTEVVIASGRHYDSMKPIVELVPEVDWILSVQGGEVSDAPRKKVLHRSFLEPATVAAVLNVSEAWGATTVVYAVDHVFTASPENPELDFYRWLSGLEPVKVSPEELRRQQVFKINWIGEPQRMAALRDLEAIAAIAAQKVQTHEKIIEIFPHDVSKGSGLAVLAKHLNLRPEDAVVFGDAENDLSMFEWAGTSVAMPHGWPVALAKATFTGPPAPKETALALAIDAALKRRA